MNQISHSINQTVKSLGHFWIIGSLFVVPHLPYPLPSGWNGDTRAGAGEAIMDHEVEATFVENEGAVRKKLLFSFGQCVYIPDRKEEERGKSKSLCQKIRCL